MTVAVTESTAEAAALSWFSGLGYETVYAPDVGPGELNSLRERWDEVVLLPRLRPALERINPDVPPEAIDEAIRQVLRVDSPSIFANNRRFHRLLADGVDVEYHDQDGELARGKVWLVDYATPEDNDWLAMNQFTVEGCSTRRPDVVVFVNGLPLGLLELKNPADPNATIRTAYNQLQTYKQEIPAVFTYNEVLVISDGLEARAGTLTSPWERFQPWRTVDGAEIAPKGSLELKVLIQGMFEKGRFLDLVRHFVLFETDGANTSKKLAAYHQYHAVNKAVEATIAATAPDGDRRAGVLWHTQGSGKSISMVFYAGKLATHPAMGNPTLVVLTDTNDLDDQLFDQFAASSELLRQEPVQAESRAHLRELLRRGSGGIVFTTVQKFLPDPGERYPALSERRNIVFIADEAHRSQYGFISGYARHMRDALPNASFVGFTGTPVELGDRSTTNVFGDYIDTYDIALSEEDGNTVPIYYEGRLAELDLSEAERPRLDPDFEEATEGEEVDRREKLKTKWARLEAMVGSPRRIELVARDIVEHFERRQEAIEGKAMIVCMSRRICVELYDAITRLRPGWHAGDDGEGRIKVVMTGSATDPPEWQQHIRNKPRRSEIAARFKNPDDVLKLVIVRDMWLTGFDVPPLHTMYIDKPVRGHTLMQTIARVNRVFRDKPGGLIVDYLGLAEELKKALSVYAQRDRERVAIPQEEAVALTLEKHEVASALLHGFDRSAWTEGTPEERLALIPMAMEHVLGQPDGKERFVKAVGELTKAFALAVPAPEVLALADDVGFLQAVRAAFVKATPGDGGRSEDTDAAVRQIVSRAIVAGDVVDIFRSMGVDRPDLSILSDDFLEEVRELPQKNVALELLNKLLNDEIRTRSRRNVVEARSFKVLLEQAIQAYKNRSLTSAEVIAQLIELAKKLREAEGRGEDLGLSEEELAFYDALAASDGNGIADEKLRLITRELVDTVRRNTTVDWALKESARANLRRLVKRLLRKHGYPSERQDEAVQLVLAQAEVWSERWAA